MLTGRTAEIQSIVANCAADRLTVIAAEPGLGSTALLKEGVIPELAEQGFVPVYFDEWQGRFFVVNLKEKIAEAVRQTADESFFAQEESLAEMLRRVRSRCGCHIVLVFDRFEDYLRCHTDASAPDGFEADLCTAISDRAGLLIVALHRDSVTQLERLSQHVPNLLGHAIYLGGISEQAGVDMVAAEAERQGLTIEPAVASALAKAPAATFEGKVHPWYLLAGIERLAKGALERKKPHVAMAALEAYGGPDRLIRESLDDTITGLRSTHLELFFRWGTLLLGPDGRRQPVSEQKLIEYSGKLNRFGLTLIPQLIELGILRAIDTAEGPRYEIARASMAPLIQGWWKRHEADLIAKSRRQFRVTSISVAVGSIVMLYVVWLIMTLKG